MEKDYIVILSAHIDSEDKKNLLIDNLKRFAAQNIDVCVSTHSNQYMDEIAKYVKYFIYDYNNEYITFNDFLLNSNIIDENYGKYGNNTYILSHEFGRTIQYFPGSQHSKAALILLKNGINIAKSYNYKWSIYLEYDIKEPTIGFKDLFENDILELNKLHKKCKYYSCPKNGDLNFLWGGYFIFNTDEMYNNPTFNKTNWHLNKENWIKTFNIGFFESIVETLINETYDQSDIICQDINEITNKIWNESDYLKISSFKIHDSQKFKKEILTNDLIVKIFPCKTDDNFDIYLYMYNFSESDFIIEKLEIFKNSDKIYSNYNHIINSNYWYIHEIINLNGDEDGFLKLIYSVRDELNNVVDNEMVIKLENVKIINEKLMRIEFN